VEVRRHVLAEVHVDGDSEELRNPRHYLGRFGDRLHNPESVKAAWDFDTIVPEDTPAWSCVKRKKRVVV
jgi:hypothetical protein